MAYYVKKNKDTKKKQTPTPTSPWSDPEKRKKFLFQIVGGAIVVVIVCVVAQLMM